MTFDRIARRIAATASRRLGNAVTIGAITDYGILLSPSDELVGDILVVTDYMLEIETAVFGVVLRGTSVIVDGVAFTAREDAKPYGEGATLMLALSKN
jgi:hypothetical protein